METKSGFLLIADISGFTEFIKIHNMRKRPVIGQRVADFWQSHAEQLITDLLETIIDAVEPHMILNKIEGDAALFYLEESDPRQQVQNLIDQLDGINSAFLDRLNALQFVSACPCDPCQQSKNLRLKMVFHKATFQLTQIRNLTELAGEDVILIHRLLKNSIRSDEYWLFTKTFSDYISPRSGLDLRSISEQVDNFGTQSLSVVYLTEPEPCSAANGWLIKAQNYIKMMRYYR